jgi:hypothetical protein
MNATEHPTYEIKTVADFLKVPEDRRAACLKEFVDFLDLAGATLEMANSLSDLMKLPKDQNRVEAFTWIDDGEQKRTLNLIAVPDPDPASATSASAEAAPTPETDAANEAMLHRYMVLPMPCPMTEFSRWMERQRDEARAKMKETAKDFETAFRLVRLENDSLRVERDALIAKHTHQMLDDSSTIDQLRIDLAAAQHQNETLAASNTTFQRLCGEAQDAAAEACRQRDEAVSERDAQRDSDKRFRDAAWRMGEWSQAGAPKDDQGNPITWKTTIEQRDRIAAALRLCRGALKLAMQNASGFLELESAESAVAAADAVLDAKEAEPESVAGPSAGQCNDILGKPGHY